MNAQKNVKIGQKSHIECATKKSYQQSVPHKSYSTGPFSLPLAVSQYIIGNTQSILGPTPLFSPIDSINVEYGVYSGWTTVTETANSPTCAIDLINTECGFYSQSQNTAQDNAAPALPIDSIKANIATYSLSSIFDQNGPITPAPIQPITFENDLYSQSQKEAF
jgi:hypothetical protein